MLTGDQSNAATANWLVRRFGWLVSLIAASSAVVVVFTLAGFSSRWWWRFEQASHFRLQYFWLLAFASLLLFTAKRRQLASVKVIAAMLNLVQIAPLYLPTTTKTSNSQALRIVSFNVLSSNFEHERVIDYLRHQQADVVLVMEVDPGWAESIKRLQDIYPYQHTVPRDDNFGISLLSRMAWDKTDTVEFGESEAPTIVAHYQFHDQKFVVVGTHPVPPGSRLLSALRNEHLAKLAEFVRNQQHPAIVVGDLNITSYSPFFRDLLTTANLRDTRQGWGVQASWGPLPFMEIPIDHCLVSPSIAVARRSVGPHLGSDHRPVVVDLRLPSESE